MKHLTTPGLELQAGVTTGRLENTNLENFVSKIKSWVDSQIVLKYIQNTSCNFPVFIMNSNKLK